MKKYSIILCLLLSFSSYGCLSNNIDWDKVQSLSNHSTPDEEKIEDKNGVIPKIISSLKDASKDDCIFLYKMFRGLSDYIKNAQSIKNTAQILPPTGIIKNVREDYGWQEGKFSSFTETIKSDMQQYRFKNSKNEDVGLDDVQELKTDVKDTLVKIFKLYAEGCRQAALKQK